VNEDSRAMYYAFCVITPVACCSSPDGPGQRRQLGEGKI